MSFRLDSARLHQKQESRSWESVNPVWFKAHRRATVMMLETEKRYLKLRTRKATSVSGKVRHPLEYCALTCHLQTPFLTIVEGQRMDIMIGSIVNRSSLQSLVGQLASTY